MEVTLAADGGGVAQLTVCTLDRCDAVLLCLGFRGEGIHSNCAKVTRTYAFSAHKR